MAEKYFYQPQTLRKNGSSGSLTEDNHKRVNDSKYIKNKLIFNSSVKNHYSKKNFDLNCKYHPKHLPQRSSKNVKTHDSPRKHWEQFYSANRSYNKTHFILSHCQFVVGHGYDLKHFLNGEIDWSNVEQLILWSEEPPNCPICLCAPVPARITKCGHIFCWPCVLHYLALAQQNETTKTCPICYGVNIKKDELKSVKIKLARKYSEGDKITFLLMRRQKGSMIIEPLIDDNLNDANNYRSNFNGLFSMDNFDKCLKYDSCHIYDKILKPDWEQLMCLAQDPDNYWDIPYIQEALEDLEIRISKIKTTPEAKKFNHNKHFSDTLKDTLDGAELSSHNPNNYFYFYQSIDGQPLFLHPINVKMLLAHYNSINQIDEISNAPQFILNTTTSDNNDINDPILNDKIIINNKASETESWLKCPKILENMSIVQLEPKEQTPEFMKRFRFLSHLPLYTELMFVEVSFLWETSLKLAPNPTNNCDLKYIGALVYNQFLPILLERGKKRLAFQQLERQTHYASQYKSYDSKHNRDGDLNEPFTKLSCHEIPLEELNLDNEDIFPTTSDAKTSVLKDIQQEINADSETSQFSFAQCLNQYHPNNYAFSNNLSKKSNLTPVHLSKSPNSSLLFNGTDNISHNLSFIQDSFDDEIDPDLIPYLTVTRPGEPLKEGIAIEKKISKKKGGKR